MHRLFDLPHSEAGRLLQSGAPVYLTVNPVEYHGPHLSLHNDRLISAGLVKDLHARLLVRHPEWPLLIASDLEIGVEPCFGPGSRHGRYATTRELVCEATRALAELGAKRVVLMTFHGAPLHNLALEAGVQLLLRRGVRAVAPFHVVLRALVNLDAVGRERFAEALAHIEDPAERAQLFDSLQLDFHAGFFETSVALHYAPESVASTYRSLPPCPPYPESRQTRVLAGAAGLARVLGRNWLASELDFAAAGLSWYKLQPFPGYTGTPHRATAEAGALLARFMVDAFEPWVDAALSIGTPSPPPILPWLRWATLGGRILGVRLQPGQMPGRDS